MVRIIFIVIMVSIEAMSLKAAFANQEQRAESAREPSSYALATFAGGCFWCMEKPFDDLPGVISTISGYMGGALDKPTYRQVAQGGTGHAEVVQVKYNPQKVNYKTLLGVYWKNVDPLDQRGQFCDKGSQYRTAIFYHNQQQFEQARQSSQQVTKQLQTKTLATKLEAVSTFYPAESYHQDYYLKNPVRYKVYRYGCGRDKRLQKLWGE